MGVQLKNKARKKVKYIEIGKQRIKLYFANGMTVYVGNIKESV